MLDYAVGVSRTPVDVSDELFVALGEHFDERQFVELTSAIAIENLHARFNAALGMGAAGFTEGMVCRSARAGSRSRCRRHHHCLMSPSHAGGRADARPSLTAPARRTSARSHRR